jgi:hypothetical protein
MIVFLQGNNILLVINDLCPADASNPRCANPNAYGAIIPRLIEYLSTYTAQELM